MYFDKVAQVYRLQPSSSDSDKEAYAGVGNLQGVQINIQPATAELTAISEGAFGQTFQAFVAISGILIGDKIVVSGTNDTFIVKGRQDNLSGPIPHLELVLFKGDN